MKDSNVFTVVVADDEVELRNAVCQMIDWESIGFRLVGSAGNGLDALQLVEQYQPDLLLTDIRMPFISGTELARQVRELWPLTHIAFLSSYDDFEYAQQAIAVNVVRYMLKPISMAELTHSLTEIHAIIRRQYRAFTEPAKTRGDWRSFLLPLMLDDFSDEQELREDVLVSAAASCGLLSAPQPPGEMLVLATELRRDGRSCATQDIAGSVDLVLSKRYRPFSFYSGGRILTLLLPAEQGLRELSLTLEELIQAVKRVLGAQCKIGVSRRITAFSKCHSACREAVDALRFAGLSGSGVRSIADAPASSVPPADTLELGEQLGQLESLLRSGSRAELEQKLRCLFSQAGENWDIAAMQVISTVFRVVSVGGSSERLAALRARCRFPMLNAQRTAPPELLRNMTELCSTAHDMICEQKKEGVSLMCEQAMEQINRRYMDETLCLGGISEALHVSPNYLCANMKKYAGDTFTNLLIKKRMEAAWSLLSTTNLKILDIARRCGYSDQHYFSYCFKKYHGVSPISLRRGADSGESSL